MADPSLTRSPKKWASAHGPLNEAGDNGAQVVVCASVEADVTSKHLKAAAELLTLRRDKIQIIDAENNRFKEERTGETGVRRRTREAEAKRQESKRAEKTALFRRTREPISEMRSNFHLNVFWLKVRTRGSRPRICVRSFSQFTKMDIDISFGKDSTHDANSSCWDFWNWLWFHRHYRPPTLCVGNTTFPLFYQKKRL